MHSDLLRHEEEKEERKFSSWLPGGEVLAKPTPSLPNQQVLPAPRLCTLCRPTMHPSLPFTWLTTHWHESHIVITSLTLLRVGMFSFFRRATKKDDKDRCEWSPPPPSSSLVSETPQPTETLEPKVLSTRFWWSHGRINHVGESTPWDGTLYETVHHMKRYITWDATSYKAVHHMGRYIIWDGTSHGTIHHMKRYITWDGTSHGTVHHMGRGNIWVSAPHRPVYPMSLNTIQAITLNQNNESRDEIQHNRSITQKNRW